MALPPIAPDSRTAGYLAPNDPLPPGPPLGGPLTGDTWEDFIHDLVAGITGLDNTLVRPRWQEEPPLRPDISVNWVAFGIMSTTTDFAPVFIHIDDGADGYDALQQMEEDTILCSFYGPDNEKYCSYLQRGLWVDQNHAIMRTNAVGLVSVGGMTRAADLIKERWWPRSDVEFVVRREIRYDYKVLNLLQSKGTVTAQPPGRFDEIHDDFDTGGILADETFWDGQETTWDSGNTRWDVP
jgi:hypothetical protein